MDEGQFTTSVFDSYAKAFLILSVSSSYQTPICPRYTLSQKALFAAIFEDNRRNAFSI